MRETRAAPPWHISPSAFEPSRHKRGRPHYSRNQLSRQDEMELLENLKASADWSARGARELVRLADEYGSFMLRSALAIAAVLGKEDDTRGS